MSIREIIRLEGIKGIIKNANNNWAFIDQFLKQKAPNNYRKQRKEFRKVYNEMNTKTTSGESIIKLFSDALAKVA